MANSSQNGAFSDDLKCVEAKNLPRGKPTNPTFARYASIWFQHTKFLFKRACPYQGETAKDTTQRQHRVSYNYVWFRVYHWGNIVAATVVVFSLNDLMWRI